MTGQPLDSPATPVRSQRVILTVPVRYRKLGEDEWHVGRSENISPAGVLLRAARLFEAKTPVEVMLTVPAGILPNMTGDLLFVGYVARVLRQAWSGGTPSLAIAFQHYQHQIAAPREPAAALQEPAAALQEPAAAPQKPASASLSSAL